MMEKWQQCKELSKFCRTESNKDPTALQHWQRERAKFSTECCGSKEDKNLKDYDAEVKINTKDLFQKGLVNGKYSDLEKRTQWDAHYRMIIPLKSKGKVIVKMTFEMSVIEKGVTDQDIEKTKKFILSINKRWNGNFTLQVIDTLNKCCDPIKLPIEFDIQFAYKGEKIANGERHPHKIELYRNIPITPEGIDRPRLEAGKTFMLATDPNEYNITYTYIHEFGHALGLPDEYGYDKYIDSIVQYRKPDGSFDGTQYSAFHTGKKRPLGDPQESIMGVFNSCLITERQGWVLGIAAKKVIDDKRYQCNIIFNGNNKSCSLWKQ